MPTAKINDEKLMLAMIATGDRAAYTQFYLTYLDPIYHYIFLFTKCKEDTEEIAQEIFIKIWEQRKKLTQVESVKDYLFRMAKYRMLDNIRHYQIRHRVLSEIKSTRALSQATTSDQCAYKEYYGIVQMAVGKLPLKRKIIFRLNTENGLSMNEIAQQLNISKCVVKKQLHIGTCFVRQYLSSHSEILLTVFIIAVLHSF
ncbi:MAG: sigma-70 family RNA polymerase sigma factor [Chitinophagaceae bacterium]